MAEKAGNAGVLVPAYLVCLCCTALVRLGGGMTSLPFLLASAVSSLLTAPLVTRLGCRDTLAACLTTAGLGSGIQLCAAALAPDHTILALALQVSLTHGNMAECSK